METIPSIIVSKKIKYLRIKIVKEVKDQYSENHRTMMKEIAEDLNNGKIAHVHGLENLTLLKCPFYPKRSTDSIQSPSKF